MPGRHPTPPHIVRRRIAAATVLVVAFGALVVVFAGATVGRNHHASATTGVTGARGARRKRERRADGARLGSETASPIAGREMGQPGPARPVPILMYHVTTEPPPNAPFPDLYVNRGEFADELTALRRAGYVGVTLQEVWDAWHRGGPLPRRAVVISVDDGYRSNYLYARPILRRLGWPGVLNLKVGNLSEPDYGIDTAQVRALIADGWEIDSHTIDHPDLTTVDAATLEREVAQSRRELQQRFGVPVNFFCYPAGRYDDAAIAAVRRAGYLAATTVNPGLAQPDDASRFVLDRVRVNAGVSGATLVSQLAGLGAAH